MSHETGIAASDELKNVLAEIKGAEATRFLKVEIQKEQLVSTGTHPAQSDFTSDFALLSDIVDLNKACYVFMRMDSTNDLGFDWVLIMFVPSTAPTREKMLYSSTKASMKREFGANQLKTEYFATDKDDLTLDSYLNSLDTSFKPYTTQEIELNRVKEMERLAMQGLGDKVKLSSNIAFPPTEPASEAISQFVQGSIDFAQFVVNGKDEVVEVLASRGGTGLEEVDGLVPRDRATYNLYRVPALESDGFLRDNPVIFMHAITGAGGVKEKMLFSSCKGTFLEYLTEVARIQIDRKVEVDIDDDSINTAFILGEVKARVEVAAKRFEKPKGPGNRRPAGSKPTLTGQS